jgi:hypothetical protein
MPHGEARLSSALEMPPPNVGALDVDVSMSDLDLLSARDHQALQRTAPPKFLPQRFKLALSIDKETFKLVHKYCGS